MGRRLPNLLTALSLLLCVAACVLWLRSYCCSDDIQIGTGRPYGVYRVIVVTFVGQLRVGNVRERLDPNDPDPRRSRRLMWQYVSSSWERGPEPRTLLERMKFDRLRLDLRAPTPETGRLAHYSYDTVGFPLWLPALITALPPILWLRRRRNQTRRRAADLCPRCGYDLRGLSGRCPECETAAESDVPASKG